MAMESRHESAVPDHARNPGGHCGDGVQYHCAGCVPRSLPTVAFANGVDPITNVNFAGINNTTDATVDGTPEHENFTHVIGSVDAGDRVPMSVQGNTDGDWSNWITVYIDWDQNGIFERGGDEEYRFPEPLRDSTGIDGKTTGMDIVIPIDATAGSTRMRVITKYGTEATYAAPDNTGGWGQAEDYTVDILDRIIFENEFEP